ncbi:MAG: hypothetical protein ACOYK1_01555 [Vampirovibrionia bacterium]|jgi:hypothetical protein
MPNNQSDSTNKFLSEIIDYEENIYEMTREIAGVAKRIKEQDKEEPSPYPPILKAIKEVYVHRVENRY